MTNTNKKIMRNNPGWRIGEKRENIVWKELRSKICGQKKSTNCSGLPRWQEDHTSHTGDLKATIAETRFTSKLHKQSTMTPNSRILSPSQKSDLQKPPREV